MMLSVRRRCDFDLSLALDWLFLIEFHRSLDERLEGNFGDFVALVKVERTAGVALQTRFKDTLRVI